MSPGTGAVSDHMSFCTTRPHDLACEKRRRGTAEREEKSKQLLLNPAKKNLHFRKQGFDSSYAHVALAQRFTSKNFLCVDDKPAGQAGTQQASAFG